MGTGRSKVRLNSSANKAAKTPGHHAQARQDSGINAARPIGKRRSFSRDVWLRPVLFLALVCGGAMLWAVFHGLLPMSAVLLWPLLNIVTFWFYWRDKYAAQKRTWRTPENTLHALSLMGGWPAARVAQQWMRHKTVKSSFQGTYWVTVVLNVGGLVVYLYQAVSRGHLSW